jgi:6-phosphogluconolactonase
MGEDGHIASLFPGETEAHGDTSRVYRPVIGPKPPPRRLTLGYAALAAALKVWVLVAGAGKEEALKASLTTPSSTPLGRLIAMRQHTRVFTDLTLGR